MSHAQAERQRQARITGRKESVEYRRLVDRGLDTKLAVQLASGVRS